MKEEPIQFHNGYTIALFVMAGFALLMAVTHRFLFVPMFRADEADMSFLIMVMNWITLFELILSVLTATVGVLRVRESPLALPTTAAISILLVWWVPIGTGIFFYWLLSVRKREGAIPPHPSTSPTA